MACISNCGGAKPERVPDCGREAWRGDSPTHQLQAGHGKKEVVKRALGPQGQSLTSPS